MRATLRIFNQEILQAPIFVVGKQRGDLLGEQRCFYEFHYHFIRQ